MNKMSTVEMQIAERARRHEVLTNLHNFIDEDFLQESFATLNKEGASGVDNVDWHAYNENQDTQIRELHTAFKSGRYRAPHIRRIYIPKESGGERPLSLPTVEDKILQKAVSKILTPIYEQIFYQGSYGYRPGRSPHQALDELFKEVSWQGKCYVIDADMQNYFGSIDHQRMQEFLSLRIRDRVVTRMIGKWMKAGIMEEGRVEYPKEGTPQGGVISPLLSNVYLHYALDEWFNKQVQPLLRGQSTLIRFADDFVLLFSDKSDAQRVMKVLPKRLGKYGLTLHPEKTKLIELDKDEGQKAETFDFLGFTHYMGKSRKGKRILKRKTSSKKLRGATKRMTVWIKRNRHLPLPELIKMLNSKLVGHYRYYGMTFNIRSLNVFHHLVKRQLYKWLSRRGGKKRITWEKFEVMMTEWLPLARPKIYHGYS